MRRLKEEGTKDKEKISAEVTVLLKLKDELAAAQGIDLKAGSKDKKKAKKGEGKGKEGENANKTTTNSVAAPTSSLPINEEEANRLQVMVTQQVCTVDPQVLCVVSADITSPNPKILPYYQQRL